MNSSAEQVVREFWRLMNTNDFYAVQVTLSPDLVVEWPQSNERIVGPSNFAKLNAEYPSHAPWRFTLHRLVATDSEVVTYVDFTDGVQQATCVSFFTVESGLITQMLEFFPEPYEPPANRSALTERLRP